MCKCVFLCTLLFIAVKYMLSIDFFSSFSFYPSYNQSVQRIYALSKQFSILCLQHEFKTMYIKWRNSIEIEPTTIAFTVGQYRYLFH